MKADVGGTRFIVRHYTNQHSELRRDGGGKRSRRFIANALLPEFILFNLIFILLSTCHKRSFILVPQSALLSGLSTILLVLRSNGLK